MERRRRDLLLLAIENDAERSRDLPVTASLDSNHRAARKLLLRAVCDLRAGIAAEEPGPRDHRCGHEREQRNRRNDPAQHRASLTRQRPARKRARVFEPIPLKDSSAQGKITDVRRLIAGFAAALVVGYAAFPAVAAMCCTPVATHACCAKNLPDQRAIGRAPCCKGSVEATNAPKEQVAPRPVSGSIPTLVPQSASVALLLDTGREAVPHCLLAPSPPTLGPPLRLRI